MNPDGQFPWPWFRLMFVGKASKSSDNNAPLAEKYPSISPYAYVANNPIMFIDPDGMQIEYADDPNKTNKENRQLKREFKRSQRELNRKSSEAKNNWDTLKNSKNVHTIHLNEKSENGNLRYETVPKGGYKSGEGNGGGTDIYIDLADNTIQGEDLGTNIVGIGHEEGHAFRFDQGIVAEAKLPSIGDPNGFDNFNLEIGRIKVTEEIEASHIENIIRAEIDPTGTKIPLRQTYDNIDTFRKNFINGKVESAKVSPSVIRKGYDYYKKKK